MNQARKEFESPKETVPAYRMVFFDMDGVLIDVDKYKEDSTKVGVSTWHTVFDTLGLLDQHRTLKERFKAGEFSSYMEWTDEACKVLKMYGLTKKVFLEIVSSQVFTRNARETIRELKRQGYKTAIITGSFNALAKRAQRELGVDDSVAHCDLEFDEGGKLKSWKLLPCDYEGKVDAFLQMAGKNGVSPSESVYVGDDVNDIPIFQRAGLSIAFNCNKQEVKNMAIAVVNGNDLSLVLENIGIFKRLR